MAEDQGKKDEDQYGFTPEGEALGYIGLDQAQVRAMQVATENSGDYDAAYTGIAMAIHVTDAGTRYSHINQSLPGTNFGTSANMSVGDDASAATKWDITAIPSGSIVQSATITVDIAGAAAGVCDFYETKRKWVETEATWNSYSTGNSW